MGQPAARQGSIGDRLRTPTWSASAAPAPTSVVLPFQATLTEGLSPDVRIGGLAAAVRGQRGAPTCRRTCPPPGVFTRPPTNQPPCRRASATVRINGRFAARNGDKALTCNDPADAADRHGRRRRHRADRLTGERAMAGEFLGAGWAFPVAGRGTTARSGSTSGEQAVRQAIWMVLATAPGSGDAPDLRRGPADLVFAPNTPDHARAGGPAASARRWWRRSRGSTSSTWWSAPTRPSPPGCSSRSTTPSGPPTAGSTWSTPSTCSSRHDPARAPHRPAQPRRPGARHRATRPTAVPVAAAGRRRRPRAGAHRPVRRHGRAVLRRLNAVPDRDFLAFLELLGVEPLPPRAARVPLTFSCAGGQRRPRLRPRGHARRHPGATAAPGAVLHRARPRRAPGRPARRRRRGRPGGRPPRRRHRRRPRHDRPGGRRSPAAPSCRTPCTSPTTRSPPCRARAGSA